MKHKLKSHKKTMTLIEVVITAGMLLLGVGTLLSVLLACNFLNESNISTVTALTDAQNVLERLKNIPYQDIPGYTPPTLSNLTEEAITVSCTPGSVVTEVQVNVTWKDKQRDRAIGLTTSIAL